MNEGEGDTGNDPAILSARGRPKNFEIKIRGGNCWKDTVGESIELKLGLG